MPRKEIPMIYRVIAQTDKITMTAQTAGDVTAEEAAKIAQEDVLKGTNYRPFVILPVCTAEQWKHGNINFCPRCGANVAEDNVGEYVVDQDRFDCMDCGADLDVTIRVHLDEEDEDGN